MIQFVCDTCGKVSEDYETSENNKEYIPTRWLTISNATIHNEFSNRALIYAGKASFHFCSTNCFIHRFVKEDSIDIQLKVN
jgi:hypothetical protein